MNINIQKALAHLFPYADPFSDYIVIRDPDGTYRLNEWRLGVPQPTEAELQTAYDAAIIAEANAVPELSPDEKIAQLEEDNAQLRADLESVKADNLASMAAIADLNEKINGGAA